MALASATVFHDNFSICSGLQNVCKRKQKSQALGPLQTFRVGCTMTPQTLLWSLFFLANGLISSRFLLTSNMP